MTTFQKPWFPEIHAMAQVQAMSKAELGEILHRTGSPRRQECSKADLVSMVCFRLAIYGDSRA